MKTLRHMKTTLPLKYMNMLTHTQTLFNPPPALLRLTFCLNDYKGPLELSIPTGAPRSDSCHGNPLILNGAELPSVPFQNAGLPRHTKVPGILKAGMAFIIWSKQYRYILQKCVFKVYECV